MNEESNTTTIIIVLVVLGLLAIGTVFLTRFIVRRIWRALSRVNGGGNMYRRGGAKMYHGLGGSLSA